MTDTQLEAAIKAARKNDLHARCDTMSLLSVKAGKVNLRCSCGVGMTVDMPVEEKAVEKDFASFGSRKVSKKDGE